MISITASTLVKTRTSNLLYQAARTFTSTRVMATSQFEWLVQIPDKANALQNRLKARPSHLENLKPRIASGQVVFGGATLSDQPAVGGTPDMNGSVMLVKADTKEEVIQLLKNDEYTKQGAWDVDNAKITPFRCAVRTAME